ncbi:hypothetical protein BPO_1080 [Bergeyella porcorum]|uniref:Uncharacterized protein n=1 Tax=Bergeyella porcorum TaxID=1735111 RepID=A0AAU0EZB8_9FLAO
MITTDNNILKNKISNEDSWAMGFNAKLKNPHRK